MSEGYSEEVWYHTFSAGNTSKGHNRLAVDVQIGNTRLWSTTCLRVAGKTWSEKIWVTVYQQLSVSHSDLPMDVSFTHWAPCPQHILLVMARLVVRRRLSPLHGLFVFTLLHILQRRVLSFSPRRMRAMRTIAIDDPVAWVSVGQSVTRTTVLTHSPDGATSMRPLLHYCSQMFFALFIVYDWTPEVFCV